MFALNALKTPRTEGHGAFAAHLRMIAHVDCIVKHFLCESRTKLGSAQKGIANRMLELLSQDNSLLERYSIVARRKC